ncbi:MAG: glycerol-3-phosphate 1-O-acyltransferase PlsY [Verrucomicrobiales bacterium]|nr:glycerol-3-phosphate 1-O-acyltransferase PlsY [Verrucomicrobiales bacterium]
MVALTYGLILLLSYLLGSIPSGFLVARAKGVDLRTVGSGNIGATNAMRVLGKPLGIFVLLADAAKGALACAFLPGVAARLTATVPGGDWPVIAAGVAAILGHNFTCWLRFKGGKGIATSAGVLLVLMPKALGVCLAIWLVVFALSRIVSLASILAAAALPLAVWSLGRGTPLVVVATGLGVLAIYRHRANIQRLLKGTEPRLGSRPVSPTNEPS